MWHKKLLVGLCQNKKKYRTILFWCGADVWELRSCSSYLASVGFLQQIINAVWRRAQEYHSMHIRHPLRGYSSRHPCLEGQPWCWRLLHRQTLARDDKEKNSPKLVKGPKHLISFKITSPLTVIRKLFANPHIDKKHTLFMQWLTESSLK